MTLTEALELAVDIETHHPHILLIAVGRFAVMDELLTKRDELPWGVSVAARDDPGRRATLWSPEHWTAFQELASPPPSRSVKKRIAASTGSAATVPQKTTASGLPAVQATETEQQFLLF